MNADMAGEIHLSFVPDDMGGDVERWTGPVERFEMMLAELAGNDDGGQQTQPHAEGDTLPDCLNAGKFGYVAGGECWPGRAFGRVSAGNCIPIQ